MQSFELLNSKGRKPILKAIELQWGCPPEFLKEFIFYKTNKGRIFITTKTAAEFELNIDIRKYSFGNYFGVLESDGVRLSVEGAQLVGPHATKNIIEISDLEIKDWIGGLDFPPRTDIKGYIIIKYKNDFIGCGKNTEKKLMNFIPKTRRISKLSVCETC